MSSFSSNYWVNRTMCDVLKDMRKCAETLNFAPMGGLIEEVQIMGNKMEAGLEDKKDLIRMNEEWSELRKKLKEARKELEDIVGKPTKEKSVIEVLMEDR